MAWMVIGTFCTDSERRSAVTTTSASPPLSAGAAAAPVGPAGPGAPAASAACAAAAAQLLSTVATASLSRLFLITIPPPDDDVKKVLPVFSCSAREAVTPVILPVACYDLMITSRRRPRP